MPCIRIYAPSKDNCILGFIPELWTSANSSRRDAHEGCMRVFVIKRLYLILLLLIRDFKGDTMLILTKRARKKKIDPRYSHNNQKHPAFDLVDSNHHHRY